MTTMTTQAIVDSVKEMNEYSTDKLNGAVRVTYESGYFRESVTVVDVRNNGYEQIVELRGAALCTEMFEGIKKMMAGFAI